MKDNKLKTLKNSENQDLSLYGFKITNTKGEMINTHFLGYNDSEIAAFAVKSKINGAVDIHSKFTVKAVLEALDPNELYSFLGIEKKEPVDILADIEPISKKDSFFYSIMLSADKYIGDDKDKRSIKKILGKYVSTDAYGVSRIKSMARADSKKSSTVSPKRQ